MIQSGMDDVGPIHYTTISGTGMLFRMQACPKAQGPAFGLQEAQRHPRSQIRARTRRTSVMRMHCSYMQYLPRQIRPLWFRETKPLWRTGERLDYAHRGQGRALSDAPSMPNSNFRSHLCTLKTSIPRIDAMSVYMLLALDTHRDVGPLVISAHRRHILFSCIRCLSRSMPISYSHRDCLSRVVIMRWPA